MSSPRSYLIDKDYVVQTFNESAARAYPGLKVGEKCHKCLFDFDFPCPFCMVGQGEFGPHYHFDEVRQNDVIVTRTEMPLPSGGVGSLMTVSDAEDGSSRPEGYDQMTGLINRLGLNRYLALNHAVPEGTTMAVLALDFTNLSTVLLVNGDKMAEKVLRYIARFLNVSDATVAYVGGGRFIGIRAMTGDDEKYAPEKLVRDIMAGSPLPGIEVKMGVFAGDGSTGSLHAMVGYAEVALNSILSNYAVNSKVLDLEEYRMLEAERDLLLEVFEALNVGEFDIYLQPKCEIETGAVVGAEALVRWIKADGTLVSPAAFIPLLEKSGQIAHLDRYVWEQAFKAVENWIRQGVTPLPISINVSQVDMATMDVVEELCSLAETYQIPRKLIEIEITESAYANQGGRVDETSTRLREAGFHLLIDDFGSGYTSLAMLKRIRPDIIKLDMRFLTGDSDQDLYNREVIRHVLDMAHELDMFVIAEGVETEQQADSLLRMGCRFAQGFLYYRPLPKADFAKLLLGETASMLPEGCHGRKLGTQFLLDSFLRVAEVNTENGRYRFISNKTPLNRTGQKRAKTIGEVYQRQLERGQVHPQDVDALRGFIDLDRLRQKMAGGNPFRSLSYRARWGTDWRWLHQEIVFPENYGVDNPWVLFTWREYSEDMGPWSVSADCVDERDDELVEVYFERGCEDYVFDTPTLLECVPGGFFIYEGFGDERILYANSELLRIFGCKTAHEFKALTGGSFRGVVHEEDLDRVEGVIEAQIEDGRAHGDQLLDYVSYRIVRQDGEIVWVQDFGRQLQHGDRGHLYAVFISVIADARLDTFRIAHRMGATDMLCSMLNRNGFEQRKKNACKQSGSAACVYLDLNGLHEMNNVHGHDAGDAALIAVAQVVKDAFGENDSFRIGGDEFAALLRDVDEAAIQAKLAGVQESIESLGYSASSGMAYSEGLDGEDDVRDLVTRAERAMRQAKYAYYATAGADRRGR